MMEEKLKEKMEEQLPVDYISALEKLLESEKEKKALSEQKEKLALENKEMKPKALFADAVRTSDTTILIGDLAKIIKQNGIDMGQNRLFKWMRDHGYLNKRTGDYNMPSQKAMEQGLFSIKERTILNPDGSVRITRTTKVTGKGQQYFVNKLLNNRKE